MKRFVFVSCLFIIFNLVADPVVGQQTTGSVAGRLNNYVNNNPVEKLFVHTDKEYYLSGELLWFKVYAIDGATNKPWAFSKISYIELLDTANHPVLQAKIGMNEATGTGSFYIPQSINSGSYKLRAYTRWMKNFDVGGFFEKNIDILNINRLPVVAASSDKTPRPLNMSFFPEGGNMLAGVENKVAFRMYGPATGLNFNGYLLSGADTILQFRPVYNGTGTFSFNPAPGRTYRVVIQPSSGKSFTPDLPAIYSEGAVMQVAEAANNFSVELRSKSNGKLFMLVHSKGVPQLSQVVTVQNGSGSGTIEKSQLPDGVSTVTVFNEQSVPLCERIIFKHPTQTMDLAIETAQHQYNTRKKIDLSIAVTKGLSLKDSAFLSMSVFRLDSLQQLPESDISAYLLLASEVKGPVENTALYFSGDQERSKQALDLLLLTQGWRRFNWDSVLNGQKTIHEYVPELQGHIVTGKVMDKNSGAAVAGITSFISSPSAVTSFKTAVSDEEGNIKADFSSFYGGNKLIVQGQRATNLSFTIDDPFSKNYSTTTSKKLINHVKYPKTILDQHIGVQVGNMYTGEQLQRLMLPAFVDSSAFYRKADYSYNLEKYTRFTSMEEVMREFVSIVDVRIRNKQVNFHVIDAVRKEYFPNAPLNLLDGVPVFNLNHFFEVDPFKVHSLDVVAKQYILGNSVFDGVLNWKTYKPDLNNYQLEEAALVLNYEALQLQREFYAPVYDSEQQYQSKLPDFRNVLNWSPDMLLKSGKPFSSSFYTSDLPGKYAVVVQGLSSDGVPASGLSFFEVL